MSGSNYQSLASELSSLLMLNSPPLAISFTHNQPEGVKRFESTIPKPTADGRTGKVPAGCVFWMEAVKGTFTTTPEDHANCSVGSMTHGLKTLDEVANNQDVAALLGSGWVTMEVVPQIPVIKEHFDYITYGPLREATADPDVVFLRLNAKQAMILHDAIPEIKFEGKPQCHIIAIAKEQNRIAISIGCMLSRVRTGMPNSDMTCAIPGSRLDEVLEALKKTGPIDNVVAQYASKDAARFGRNISQ